jgi:hypothetical protein
MTTFVYEKRAEKKVIRESEKQVKKFVVSKLLLATFSFLYAFLTYIVP